jgi:ABC-type transport system involved in multi-copper enzyme maturation permease subunit
MNLRRPARALARSTAGRFAAPGVSAIVVKELRGRMRGRRTFATLTIFLGLLGAFGWMLQRMNESQINFAACPDLNLCSSLGFGGSTATFASAAIGRGVFVGLMMVMTLLVAVLAGASTAGAISGERERQTLDLLAVTPISSLAIVLGKLATALAWVFLLILASVPITALVFVFGGVAPDDIIRGYVVLVAAAIGLGSIGLFFSALLKRTGASTGLTYMVVLVLTVGSVFAWEFMNGTNAQATPVSGVKDGAPDQPVPAVTSAQLRPPPQALLYLNPFIAEADVACGTEGGFGTWCSVMGAVTDGGGDILGPLFAPTSRFLADDIQIQLKLRGLAQGGVGANGNPNVAIDVPGQVPVESLRDRLWPKTVASFLLVSLILTFLSIQLVTPTRRWRFARPQARQQPVRTEDA